MTVSGLWVAVVRFMEEKSVRYVSCLAVRTALATEQDIFGVCMELSKVARNVLYNCALNIAVYVCMLEVEKMLLCKSESICVCVAHCCETMGAKMGTKQMMYYCNCA